MGIGVPFERRLVKARRAVTGRALGKAMIVSSSGISPTPRGTSARAVAAVSGPERQGVETRRPRGEAPGVVLDQTARPAGDEVPFIDAELIDVLREASVTATVHVPEDDTLRQALRAYHDAAGAISLRGVVLDLEI